MLGQLIGNYRIVQCLGEGGMGSVYEAVHEQIGRRVAIKVLHPQFSRDRAVATRFFNEARAANVTAHPGIVEVFEFGHLADGTSYIIMQLLQGESLGARQKRLGGPMPIPEALRLIRQIASALREVHEKGIVHRDLKPGNVMIVPEPEAAGGERAKVLDFGIAKLAEQYQRPDLQHPQTQTGALLGTPAYMAPEQCRGSREVDARADVYSLGVMLYQLLAGRLPFASADGFAGLIAAHLFEQPLPVPPLGIAAQAQQQVEALLASTLAKVAAERPSMQQVVEALQQIEAALSSRAFPTPTRPWSGPRIAATTAAVLAAAAIAELWLVARRLPEREAKAGASTLRESVSYAPNSRAPATPSLPPVPPPEMVLIAGGRFSMGSTSSEIDSAHLYCQQLAKASCPREWFERESPAHEVQLSDFYLDRHEVTNQEVAVWLNKVPALRVDGSRVLQDNALLLDLSMPYSGLAYRDGRFTAREGYGRQPIVQISWTGAKRYCEAQEKSLPTEAQWEYAARGPQGRRFPWGSPLPTCDGVVFDRRAGGACAVQRPGIANAGGAPQDVTPEGVHDLGGNVAEWVSDPYVAPYPDCGRCLDPRPVAEVKGSSKRGVRGGDFNRTAELTRGASRSRRAADDVQGNIGLRCARSKPPIR